MSHHHHHHHTTKQKVSPPTGLLEDDPTLLLPLVIDPGACNLTKQFQSVRVGRGCDLVDLRINRGSSIVGDGAF